MYIILYYIILYYIISYYIILYNIILYYIILYYIILYYIILYYIILYYIILYYIILYHIILHHIILYYIILYHQRSDSSNSSNGLQYESEELIGPQAVTFERPVRLHFYAKKGYPAKKWRVWGGGRIAVPNTHFPFDISVILCSRNIYL